MFYLLTLGLAIPSPLFAFSEAWAVFIGLVGQRHWLLVAFTLAVGQTIGFTLMYIFGERLLPRIRKLDQAAKKLNRERIKAHAPWVLALGAVTGVPPHLAMCALAPVLRIPYALLLPITFLGRMVRFGVLAGVPQAFSGWFDPSGLPEWVLALT